MGVCCSSFSSFFETGFAPGFDSEDGAGGLADELVDAEFVLLPFEFFTVTAFAES
jgi:hypothetical protein